MRTIYFPDGNWYVVNEDQDFHTTKGFIKKDDLVNVPNGTRLRTSMDKPVSILDTTFADRHKKLKRLAQIITPKDAGLIIAETLVGKDSVVVDAGGGSGALTSFFAHYVKEVHCFDNREDHVNFIQKNLERLELTNVHLKLQDVYEGIPVENADLIVLDLPEPWQALEHVMKSLKPGGYFVSYLPCTNQLHQIVNAVEETAIFVHIKSVELREQHWKVAGKAIRPDSKGPFHTGFLSFFKKIQ